MSNSDRNWPDEYSLCVILARLYPNAAPGTIAANVHRIKRHSDKLRRIFTRQCNEGHRDGDDKKVDNIKLSVAFALTEIASDGQPIAFEINHDPRGRAIKLHLPNNADGYSQANDLSGLWAI